MSFAKEGGEFNLPIKTLTPNYNISRKGSWIGIGTKVISGTGQYADQYYHKITIPYFSGDAFERRDTITITNFKEKVTFPILQHKYVYLNKASHEIEEGQSFTLVAKTNTGRTITWKSGNYSIASVYDGVVTAIDRNTRERTLRDNGPDGAPKIRITASIGSYSGIEDYNDFIGKDTSQSNSCGSIGSCTYDVKGFSYDGTNVSKNMSISNLKVRLMQCEPPYGNGSYTTPVSNELVDFENYVAGVAYAEVGDGAPIEQYKTQMVAARSFALSRPTSMGNSRGLKLEQENGQWILQISSCVADQVYCNIDKGCHDEGGGSEGGYTVDGDDPSAWYHKPALPEGHDIRKAAEATQGEVLVNGQGYIINTGFLMTEQNLWASLAKQGLNYKQILMKTYGSGGIRSSGATDIKKASCSGGGGTCATGEFTTWRQGDPQWSSTPMGSSGSTLGQIGCLVTSVSIQMARSGVQININPFNPGTFVEFLNKNGGIASGGNFVWASPQQAAPTFVYQGQEYILGLSKEEKLNKINSLVSQKGVYVVAEVKGNTGQHWVAVMGVNGSSVEMVDPASDATDMWSQYNWANTSFLAYYKAG